MSDLFNRIKLARLELRAADLCHLLVATAVSEVLRAFDAGNFDEARQQASHVRREVEQADRHIAYADHIIASAAMPLTGPLVTSRAATPDEVISGVEVCCG